MQNIQSLSEGLFPEVCRLQQLAPEVMLSDVVPQLGRYHLQELVKLVGTGGRFLVGQFRSKGEQIPEASTPYELTLAPEGLRVLPEEIREPFLFCVPVGPQEVEGRHSLHSPALGMALGHFLLYRPV